MGGRAEELLRVGEEAEGGVEGDECVEGKLVFTEAEFEGLGVEGKAMHGGANARGGDEYVGNSVVVGRYRIVTHG